MNSQFFLGACVGWIGGLFFGRFVVGTILNIIRGTSMVKWIREHIDFRGVAVIIMALATGLSLIIALHATSRSDAATQTAHELAACQRDYLQKQSKATGERADANAPTQAALQKFLQSVGPLILNRVAGRAPTADQLALVRSTYISYNRAAMNLNQTLKDTPLPPSPDQFCKGVG